MLPLLVYLCVFEDFITFFFIITIIAIVLKNKIMGKPIPKEIIFVILDTKLISKRISLLSELRFKHENGEYIPISLKGNLIRTNNIVKIILIIGKISKPTKLLNSYIQSEKKYHYILENMMEGYYESDFKGNFLYVNTECCKILGYSKEELIGNNFRSIFREETNELLFKNYNQESKIVC